MPHCSGVALFLKQNPMKRVIITIDKKKYPIKFSWKAFKILANFLGIKKINKLFTHIATINFNDPEFDEFEVIGFLVLSGIMAADDTVSLTIDDIMTWVFSNPEGLNDVIVAFNEAMPQQDLGKGKAHKSQPKKNK